MTFKFTPMKDNPNTPYPRPLLGQWDLPLSNEKQKAFFTDVMTRDINAIHETVRRYLYMNEPLK